MPRVSNRGLAISCFNKGILSLGQTMPQFSQNVCEDVNYPVQWSHHIDQHKYCLKGVLFLFCTIKSYALFKVISHRFNTRHFF